MYGTLGFSIASHNTVSRAMYAIGRDGLLHGHLARTHRRFRTPVWAIGVVTALELVLGLPTGLLYGGDNAWYYLGFIATLALVLVYISINVSLVSVIRRRYRAEFRVFRHLVVPTVGMIVMGAALVGNIYPVPASPYRWFPYVVLGLLLAGGATYLWLRRARPDKVESSGAILAGEEEFAGAFVTDQALGEGAAS